MNNFEPAALDEGNVAFVKLDNDTFAITGANLATGQTVNVTTKAGTNTPVIVKKIIKDEGGIQTATFDWIKTATTEDQLAEGNIVFRQLDNGDYVIQGVDLRPGEKVKVTTKGGNTPEVVVGEIIEITDEATTATFQWVETDLNELLKEGKILFQRLQGDGWGITGQGLKPGKQVKVTKRDETQKTLVTVKEIIKDDGTIQTATFEWGTGEKSELEETE